MDSARSWLQKLQPRDKDRGKPASPTAARKDGAAAMAEDGEEAISSTTATKVAAAKQFIENHYKDQMRSLEERKERSVPPLAHSACYRSANRSGIAIVRKCACALFLGWNS